MNGPVTKEAGDGLAREGRWAEALEVYQRVLREKTEDQTAATAVRFNCGFCLKKMGRYQEAVSNFQRVLEVQPTHSKAVFNQAECHQALGDHQKSVDCYLTASKLDPSLTGLVSQRVQGLAGPAIQEMKADDLQAQLEGLRAAITLTDFEFEKALTKAALAAQVSAPTTKSFETFLEILKVSVPIQHKIRLEKIIQILYLGRFLAALRDNSGSAAEEIHESISHLILVSDHLSLDIKAKLAASLKGNLAPQISHLQQCSEETAAIFFRSRQIDAHMDLAQLRKIVKEIYRAPSLKKVAKEEKFWERVCARSPSTFPDILTELLQEKPLDVSFTLELLRIWAGTPRENASLEDQKLINSIFQEGTFRADLDLKSPEIQGSLLETQTELLQNPSLLRLIEKRELLDDWVAATARICRSLGVKMATATLAESLLDLQQQKKTEVSPSVVDEFRKPQPFGESLSSPNVLKVLSVACRTPGGVRQLLNQGRLVDFLVQVRPPKREDLLLYFDILICISLATKEEKLKAIQEKYSVAQEERGALEKLVGMSEGGVVQEVTEAELASSRFFPRLYSEGGLAAAVTRLLKDPLPPLFEKQLFTFLTKMLRQVKLAALAFNESIVFEQLQRQKSSPTETHKLFLEGGFPFACCLVGGLEVSQIAYKNLGVLTDALSSGVKETDSDLLTFEALLGLTRITGEHNEEAHRVWDKFGLRHFFIDFVSSDNGFVRCAALELLLNCLINPTVMESLAADQHLQNTLASALASLVGVFAKAVPKTLTPKFGNDVYVFERLGRLLEFLKAVESPILSMVSGKVASGDWASAVNKWAGSHPNKQDLLNLVA